MVKENWHRKNNKTEEPKTSETPPDFEISRYEWAFALAALTVSLLIGAIIIKCYTKKYLQPGVQNTFEPQPEKFETMVRAASREHKISVRSDDIRML